MTKTKAKTITAGPAAAFSRRVIRASAGTGKTYQLSGHYLRLLDAGAAGEQILATTFTRKAAGEILERVLLRLADAAFEPASLRQLASQLDDAGLTRERCLELLGELTANLHRLRVSTLDSFFAQLARAFSLELHLPPGWQIVDELEDQAMRGEAVQAVLQQDDTRATLQLMHLLTKGEASRGVSQLMRDTVDQLYGLFEETTAETWRQLPAFKPLAADELERVLDELRGLPLPPSLQKARDADCARAGEGNWKDFIGVGLAAKCLQGQEVFNRQPIPAEVRRLYDRLLEHARAELVGLIARQTEGTYQLLERFHEHYQRLKQRRRALRFEDVTRRLAAGVGAARVRQFSDVADLAFRLDAHLDHLLLDEFQDTSPQQWQVVRPFARRVTSQPGASFFCVGDVKQAIYGWRGGSAEIFDYLEAELPGLVAEPLNKSYRSSQPVIDTVNAVFRGLDRHPSLDRFESAVRQWCQRFPEHETARGDLPGYACLETAPAAADDQRQAEATWDYAARRVAELAAAAPGREIGVLVRRNQVVGGMISRLRALGIDASEEGGNPLTDAASVQLVLSALRLADHPGDSVARFHLLHSPLAGPLGLTDLRDGTAWRVSRDVSRALLDEGYGTVIGRWAGALADHCNRREWNRLKQLVELAYAYEPQATLRADRFAQLVETQRVADPSSAAVRVMTVHQAKGLEFEIVVLPELDASLVGQPDWFVVERPVAVGPVGAVCRYAGREVQQLLPQRFQQMFEQQVDRDVAEALCVLYVALTRAARALYMIIAPSPERQKSVPKTSAGLLRAALVGPQPVAAEVTLFETGQADWYAASTSSAATSTAAGTPALSGTTADVAPGSDRAEPLRVTLAPRLGRQQRRLEAASPSALEGGGRVALDNIWQASRSDALLRGSIVHAWFEQVAWLDEGPPPRDALREAARPLLRDGAASKLPLEEWLDEFYGCLNHPVVARALCRDSYPPTDPQALPASSLRGLQGKPLRLEVEAERPFAIRQDDRLLSGIIDRLIWMYDDQQLAAAEIIDFKTDAVAPSNLSQLAERIAYYEPQMEAYRLAVSQLSGLPPQRVSVRLLFVQAGVQHYVPHRS
ncbi:MAG: UvrD-helicase domain-containing protein [Pirellulaceae bacterium]|nr:UvrD-helicase domain-containing protein [Pirellulaceae bacterium]